MEIRKKGLLERFKDKEVVLVGEGYILELARRGYQQLGTFVPIVCADDPHKVEELSREFAFNGSNVTQAFTYNSYDHMTEVIGRKPDSEKINRNALSIAKKVAAETNTLFSFGLNRLKIYDPKYPKTLVITENIYRKQVAQARECDVDYIAIETMADYGEASIALKVCKEFDIPAVVTLAPWGGNKSQKTTFDSVPLMEALVRLENEGAAAVGFNCVRGPLTMVPLIREAREHVKGPLACLCIGYRTTEEAPDWYKLRHPLTNKKTFCEDLCANQIALSEVKWFGEECKEIGVDYIGFCCGNEPRYMRTLCEVFDRNPPSQKYKSDHEKYGRVIGGVTNRYTVEWKKFTELDF